MSALWSTFRNRRLVSASCNVGRVLVPRIPTGRNRLFTIAPQCQKSAASETVSLPAQDPDKITPIDPIHTLDLRVGRITSIEEHPDAEKLFVERVDVGEASLKDEGGRVIVSGLRGWYTAEQLKHRLVVVVFNLKASKLRGIRSNGMLLAAYDDATVEILEPPKDSVPGQKIVISLTDDEMPNNTQKRKANFSGCQPFFRITDEGAASYKGRLLQVEGGGNVTVRNLKAVPFA
ncbi:hypothetical protein DFS34DRAFT_184427 [Phlyctochytrium arcticum]|nr:hypothetical protein DFS34DRAFT_184427 [Phlyctochytrium arcticum]